MLKNKFINALKYSHVDSTNCKQFIW